MSGIPDTNSSILAPLWESVHWKEPPSRRSGNANSRATCRQKVDTNGHGRLSRFEPRPHLGHRDRKARGRTHHSADHRAGTRYDDVEVTRRPVASIGLLRTPAANKIAESVEETVAARKPEWLPATPALSSQPRPIIKRFELLRVIQRLHRRVDLIVILPARKAE